MCLPDLQQERRDSRLPSCGTLKSIPASPGAPSQWLVMTGVLWPLAFSSTTPWRSCQTPTRLYSNPSGLLPTFPPSVGLIPALGSGCFQLPTKPNFLSYFLTSIAPTKSVTQQIPSWSRCLLLGGPKLTQVDQEWDVRKQVSRWGTGSSPTQRLKRWPPNRWVVGMRSRLSLLNIS